jgi:DNA-binding transcriptional regulator YiaG
MSSRSASPTRPLQSKPRVTARRSFVDQPGNYDPLSLRSTRDELGLSQSVFADLVGVSKSLVEHWERGLRGPSVTARRLLDAIRARPAAFLSQVHSARKDA